MKTRLILPEVVLCTAKDRYDLAMHFLRYQESYESTSTRFRNKSFKLLDFMEWYSKKQGDGAFTYPTDWAGFNIPSAVVTGVHALGISDYNRYDERMRQISEQVVGGGYIIGAQDPETIQHELAHALFYTNSAYRGQACRLVREMPAAPRFNLVKELKRLGYAQNVHVDECQAYMATGLTRKMRVPAHLRAPFKDLFKYYAQGVK